MIQETYSAGLISQSFWFVEMKKVIKLIDDGKSEEEIKKMCIDENLFGAAKEYRAKRIYGYIWNRAKRLDKTLIDLFCTSDLATQKVINLIAILRSDRLFFEFMFEVYREKNILGIPIIEDADVNIFFKNKEIQSEDIAAWTDGTKRRLRSIYFNYLTDANLLTVVDKKKTITPPILDVALERYLEACGESVIIKAITGWIKMMSLDERLNKAEEMIQKPSFRENKGLGNEVGYYIFDYPAEKELYIRERIEYIKKKSENSDDDFKVMVFDLYDIMIDILIKKGYLEKCYQFEKTKGFERVSKSISNMLRITSSDSLIVNYIKDNTPEKSVVFITGIGKCYPILRSHTVLNNLHQVIDNVPVVMFYPGNYDGQELVLFGEIKDDNYYRAFKLVD